MPGAARTLTGQRGDAHMKRFAATVGAVAFAVTALASGAGAQGTTAPAKTDPKPEVKTETKTDAKGAMTTPAPAKSTTATPATPATPAAPAKAAADKKPMGKVDINTASAADLTAAGFTEDEAKKIVDGRPWKSKDELVKKNAVSEQSYKKAKNGIVAHQMKAEAKKTK